MIPDSFKLDLLNRVDIVDVISVRVPLKKAGANWSACCPFHTEKTPSFTVSPTKQFYHCFGCGAHGNAIGFLMEYAGLGYVDAMRELAEGVGMKLPELEPRSIAKQTEAGPDLYDFMSRAAKFYRGELKGSVRAVDYLKGRGLTGQIAARFGIGYAPDDWQGLETPFPGYADKALVDCGLVIVNDAGKRYDRFRDRVMFPILNQRGFVIGFGGRVIGDGEPKYMNSPETPLFEKGRELYGLPQARLPIREQGCVVVVEGYMDVVMLAQHGVENAVATLGTATTPTHVHKLLRQADEVVFCFDGDAAGRRAAWHALEVSLEALTDHKAVRFLFLPTEHDPDSFVRERGREAFAEEVALAQPLSAFFLSHLQAQNDLSSLEGRARLLAEAKPLVKRIAAPALQLQMTKALAELTGMAQGEVARLSEIRLPGRFDLRSAPPKGDRARANRSTESKLLRAILAMPELAADVPVELVTRDAPDAAALREVAAGVQRAGSALPRPVSAAFEDRPCRTLLADLEADLLVYALADDDIRTEFQESLRRLQEGAVAGLIKALETKEKSVGLGADERAQYSRLIREHAALRHALGASSTVL